jgi:hypothetical protein
MSSIAPCRSSKRAGTASNDARQSRRRHIDACLEATIGFINNLCLQDPPLMESNVVLTTAFSCEKDLGTEFDAYRPSGSLHLEVSRPLQASMLRGGWCKTTSISWHTSWIYRPYALRAISTGLSRRSSFEQRRCSLVINRGSLH